MSQSDRQLPNGDLSCLVDLVPDMASLMQAERNVGGKDLVILGGLVLVSPLPKTEWEQLGAKRLRLRRRLRRPVALGRCWDFQFRAER